MVVPSIGQAIPSSTSSDAPSATERSGNGHTVPITWHKVKKKSTRKRYCVFTRRIMSLAIDPAGPAQLRCVVVPAEASMSSLAASSLPCSAIVVQEDEEKG